MNRIQAILQKSENDALEFKTSFDKEAIETIVAFANQKGGGLQ